MSDENAPTRARALAALSAAAAAGMLRAPAGGAQTPAPARTAPAPLAPDVQALLAELAPANGRIAAERVRASGIPVGVLMRRLIPWARTFADPPISQFYVGAIIEGASGSLYAGMNLEFPGQSMASTVHGEGAATANAWLHDETGIVSLAVGGTPCGYCRQYLAEFVAPERLRIWMSDGGSITLADALPNAFLPSVLGVTTDPFHAHTILRASDVQSDPLTAAAFGAAQRSHAPYSRTPSGIALRLKDGTIVTGRYAENVAFNPGMPPLQSALIALRLRGYTYADIRAATLVDVDGSGSQRAVTRDVLSSIGTIEPVFVRATPAG